MQIGFVPFLSAGLLLCLATASSARTLEIEPVDAAYLQGQSIVPSGKLIFARRIRDRHGEHLLILHREASASPMSPKSGRLEHIELNAACEKAR